MNLLRNFDLILTLTLKEIKVKYRSSALGYLWSLLYPLLLALLFFFALRVVLKIQVEDFVVFLLSGLFSWQWFLNSLSASTVSIISNASLVKKVKFPYFMLPMSNVLNDCFHFIASLPVLFAFAIFHSKPPSIVWLAGTLFIVLQLITTLGISLILSSLNPFFRDLERLTQIGLNMVFYATPIIYPFEMIPENFRPIFYLNPMFPVVESWHRLILKSDVELWLIGLSVIHSAFWLVIGSYIFSRFSKRFAEVL
ncbi:MAG: ABC transporter permease [Aquificaceae bacterium]